MRTTNLQKMEEKDILSIVENTNSYPKSKHTHKIAKGLLPFQPKTPNTKESFSHIPRKESSDLCSFVAQKTIHPKLHCLALHLLD